MIFTNFIGSVANYSPFFVIFWWFWNPLVRKRLHPMLQITKSTRFGKNRSFHENFILYPTFYPWAKSEIFRFYRYFSIFWTFFGYFSGIFRIIFDIFRKSDIFTIFLILAQKFLKADFDRKPYIFSFQRFSLIFIKN